MKGKKSECIVLKKMIRYCDEISQILKKHNSDKVEFDNNSEFQFAVGMCIIQIGELASRLGDDFIKIYADVPWRQIKGMHNVYAHDYDIVDGEMVWETVTEEIPELKEKLQIILDKLC